MIQKSIDRLKYTFSKGNKPNQNDFVALNDVINYVNQEKEREIIKNHLFAKLFLNGFKNDLLKNGGNYQMYIDRARIALKISLEEHYEELHGEMNHLEYIKFAKSKGITMKHPVLKTQEEEEKDIELLKTHELDLIKHLDHFKKEAVYDRVNKLLNNMIEDYN